MPRDRSHDSLAMWNRGEPTSKAWQRRSHTQTPMRPIAATSGRDCGCGIECCTALQGGHAACRTLEIQCRSQSPPGHVGCWPPADIWVSVRYPHSRTFRMGTEAAISAPTLLDQSTLRPWIDQTVGMLPSPAVLGFKTVVPFISHIATSPVVVFRQRMSLLPSPLKSPVSTMDQVVATFPTPAALKFKTVVPYISQIATSPVLASRQRMSVEPLPSKSPVPTMTQLSGTTPILALAATPRPNTCQTTSAPVLLSRQNTLPRRSTAEIVQLAGTAPSDPACWIERPSSSQIATVPVLLSRQRMSPLPSRLKSAVPTIDQLAGTAPSDPVCRTLKVSISQMATVPVLASRHSKSQMPSLLKSRWPTICQLVGTAPTLCTEEMGEGWDGGFALCISHLAMAPPLCRQTISLVWSSLKSCVET